MDYREHSRYDGRDHHIVSQENLIRCRLSHREVQFWCNKCDVGFHPKNASSNIIVCIYLFLFNLIGIDLQKTHLKYWSSSDPPIVPLALKKNREILKKFKFKNSF